MACRWCSRWSLPTPDCWTQFLTGRFLDPPTSGWRGRLTKHPGAGRFSRYLDWEKAGRFAIGPLRPPVWGSPAVDEMTSSALNSYLNNLNLKADACEGHRIDLLRRGIPATIAMPVTKRAPRGDKLESGSSANSVEAFVDGALHDRPVTTRHDESAERFCAWLRLNGGSAACDRRQDLAKHTP
jgi:hypothetical protein